MVPDSELCNWDCCPGLPTAFSWRMPHLVLLPSLVTSLVFGASIPCPSRACKHLFARRVEPLSCWRMGGVGALPAALVQGAGPGPRPNLQLQWIFSLLPCWVDWMGYNWLWESPSIVFISLTGSMCFGEHSRECFCFSLVVVVVLNVCPLAWKKVCL